MFITISDVSLHSWRGPDLSITEKLFSGEKNMLIKKE